MGGNVVLSPKMWMPSEYQVIAYRHDSADPRRSTTSAAKAASEKKQLSQR
jgi:hypothetical protein